MATLTDLPNELKISIFLLVLEENHNDLAAIEPYTTRGKAVRLASRRTGRCALNVSRDLRDCGIVAVRKHCGWLHGQVDDVKRRQDETFWSYRKRCNRNTWKLLLRQEHTERVLVWEMRSQEGLLEWYAAV